MQATIQCPGCRRTIGGRNTEGTGWRLRLSITLVDDNGDLHGPCPHCKQDVIVAKSAGLAKSLVPADCRPVLVIHIPART